MLVTTFLFLRALLPVKWKDSAGWFRGWTPRHNALFCESPALHVSLHLGGLPGQAFSFPSFRPRLLCASPSFSLHMSVPRWSHPFSRLPHPPPCGCLPSPYLSPILSLQVQTCIPSCLLFISHWKLDVNTSTVNFITSLRRSSPGSIRSTPNLSPVSLVQAVAETWRFLPGPRFPVALSFRSPNIFPSAPCCLLPGGLPPVCRSPGCQDGLSGLDLGSWLSHPRILGGVPMPAWH